MKTAEIIERAKRQTKTNTINELLALLEVTASTLSLWRNNKAIPSPEHAQRLAELARMDPAPYVLQCLMQTTQDTGLRRTLHRFKIALAAAAAALPAFVLSVLQCILC